MKKDRKQKKYIFICHGKDCSKRGCKELQKSLEKSIKQQPGRSNIELIKTRCMDHCKEGPSVVVNNTWYGEPTVEDILPLLK